MDVTWLVSIAAGFTVGYAMAWWDRGAEVRAIRRDIAEHARTHGGGTL